MTPEADRYLQNADNHLERGKTMLSAGLNDDAGRAAYLAAFHAAQALIFEGTGKVLKSHKAVNIEFLRLTKDDPRFIPGQRRFLSQAYEFKAVADYDSGPMIEVYSNRLLRPWKRPTRLLELCVSHVTAT